MAPERPADRRTAPPLGWRSYAAVLVVFAVLIGLGTWQVQRLHWKEDLLATIEERRNAEPLPLEQVERQFASTNDVDYRAVSVSGRLLHEKEQFFFATWRGRTGFYVYTPLQLADGRVVFVNRGFVPYEMKDALTRAAGQIEGEVTITGLARNPLAEKPSMLVPDNEPQKDIFYWKDRNAMAVNAGLDPALVVSFFVDADAAPNPGGLPQGGVTFVDLPNSHLQYAVTWYGLAVALLAVFATLAWRQRRAARP